MDYETQNRFAAQDTAGAPFARARAVDIGLTMRDIYWWMTVGLAVTGIVAMTIARTPAAVKFIFGTPGLIWVFFAAELGLVIGLSWGLKRMSSATATILFLLYAGVTGLTLSAIFLVYTASDIGLTFFITAGTFASMAIYGTVTKRDLTGMGHFAMMGLFGLIIAMIVNFFLHSAMLYWLVSFAGVLVFTLLTAYDVQRLRALAASGAIPEKKLAIFGALNLYLDFINLFIFLLSILGGRRR